MSTRHCLVGDQCSNQGMEPHRAVELGRKVFEKDARRFDLKPTTVRILFLLSCLLPGPQFVAYLVLWALIPKS